MKIKYFISTILIIIFIICFESNSLTQPQQNKDNPKDTLNASIIKIKPETIELKRPAEGKFVETKVKIFNRGSIPLYINKVEGSCKCATAKVKFNPIYPFEVGEIGLTINLDGVDNDHNKIQFFVQSSAKNSPSTIFVTILPPDSVTTK